MIEFAIASATPTCGLRQISADRWQREFAANTDIKLTLMGRLLQPPGPM
jgi:hypothetical protein